MERRVDISEFSSSDLEKIAMGEDPFSWGDSYTAVMILRDRHEQAILERVVRASACADARQNAVKGLEDRAALERVARSVETNPLDREIAVELLIDRGSRQKFLASVALGDPDSRVRRQAICGLKMQGYLSRVAFLDPEGWVRVAAIERLTDQSSLIRLARSDAVEDFNMRCVASDRLRAIGWWPEDSDGTEWLREHGVCPLDDAAEEAE